MHYLIIGGGVAGTTAAEQLRKNDPSGDITMLEREPYRLYSRIRLPEFLAGTLPEADLFLRTPQWYTDRDIHLLTGRTAAQIDTAARRVVTSQGDRLAYDRLLLATGGLSFRPPIAGLDREGVFALRTLDDARRIRRHVEQHRQVVMLGGGVLGLEAANALIRAGASVTVIEVFPRLLPRQMDRTGGALLCRQLEDAGFRFVLGVHPAEILGNTRATGVRLDDGRRIDGDTVIVSAGVRPDRQLADAVGLAGDRGVAVDDRMRTPLSGLYAAGDLVEHRGRFYGLWPAAVTQGEVAGANMAGLDRLYEGTLPSNVLRVVGTELLAAGDIDGEERCDSITFADPDRFRYRKLVIRDDCVVGAILYGDLSDSARIRRAVRARKNIGNRRRQIEAGDLETL